MFPDTKIVQAEGRTKFIWDLPRRRLSKRRLVLRKVVQAERRTKFIWDLPRRRLSKRRLVLRKVVQAEGRTKFIWVLPRRCLSKRRLVLRKVVQAERKSKLVCGFAEARFRESGRQFVPGKDTNESIKALFLLREISDCSSACSTSCQTCGRLPPLADFRAAAAHHAVSVAGGVGLLPLFAAVVRPVAGTSLPGRLRPQFQGVPRHSAACEDHLRHVDLGDAALLHLRSRACVVVGAGGVAAARRRAYVAYSLLCDAAAAGIGGCPANRTGGTFRKKFRPFDFGRFRDNAPPPRSGNRRAVR